MQGIGSASEASGVLESDAEGPDVMSWSENMFRVSVSQSVSGCLTSLRAEE